MDAVDPFDTNSGFWSEMDEMDCPCKGFGWAERNGVIESCAIHYTGQLHPESKELLLDEPVKLQEEERKSHLQWKISKAKEKIKELQSDLKQEQKCLVLLELELINKTPTVEVSLAALPLEESKRVSK